MVSSRWKIGGSKASADQPRAASETVREALRSATGSSHASLHSNVAFAALIRGELSHSGYAGLLRQLYGLHMPIEKRLAQFRDTSSLAWWDAGATSTRASQLRHDLEMLGMDGAAIAEIVQADTLLPNPGCPAAALGCAWVTEGSALGGRVMASHVVAILGQNWSEKGGSFFTSSSKHSERWRRCCDAVESYRNDPASIKVMVAAATQTFEAFETWLDMVVWD